MILQNTEVLIVDAEDTRLILESFVRKEGGAVLTAKSGAEAMSMLRHTKIDLVICNLVLPEGMKGDMLCEKLRADDQVRQDVPFVLFTTQLHSETSLVKMKARIGANAIVPFPFRPDDFRKILTEILSA